ncbi:MAG: ParA family protein [Acidobacteriota bacterium]
MKIFACYSIKGGVGKTAAAVNLGWCSAAAGARTLIWDLDPQAAATFYFRVAAKVKGGGKKLVRGQRELAEVIKGTDYPRLDLLPAAFSYRKMDQALEATADPRRQFARLLQPLSGEYDHLILDCAPSISQTSESVFVAADALLVPTIPTPLSMRTLDQIRRHLKKRGPKRLEVLPFFSMVDRRKSLHKQIVAEADGSLLRSYIPYSTLVERMGLYRAPLGEWVAKSEPANAYRTLWQEVLARV